MIGFGRVVAAAVLCCAVPALVSCTKSDQGTPVPGSVAAATTPATTPATATTTAPAGPGTSATDPTGDTGHPDFGVVPTSTTAVPAGAVTCEPAQRPPVGMVAEIADSAAPVLTVAVPEGWSMQGGTGDIGAELTGPDGMSATVTILATSLDPQAAFAEYVQALTADAAVSSLSVLPAELCDYSGQKLLGAVSDTPDDATEFVDRVVHVWTNTGDYLVSVHAEAPAGTGGFDAAATELTGDFEIRIP
ncbi:hypothetical protein L2K20_02555 [Mycobacterium sp. MBM]|nr:hypothetical protein [Mycobacterium sp. MBM]